MSKSFFRQALLSGAALVCGPVFAAEALAPKPLAPATSTAMADNKAVVAAPVLQAKEVKSYSTASTLLSETAAAKLLALVLDGYIPKVLHEEKDIVWMGGERSLKITKGGLPALDSNEQRIFVTFPLAVDFSGTIKRDAGFLKINAACAAEFSVPATITIDIEFNKKPLEAIASIAVTVPPVNANCNGYNVGIQPVIQAIIEQKKAQWQQDLQQQVSDGLMVLGL